MKTVAVIKTGNPATGEKPEIGIIDLPKPVIGKPEEVLIEVAYCSICGSDPHLASGHIAIPCTVRIGP
jgi:(R,R)-butanediol dehydrogenase/meso-butanediol dehydrogenase/diacetyl reductase